MNQQQRMMKMASDQYWIRRNGQQLLNVLQDGEKLHKQLKADYDLAQRNILKEIEALYGRFAKDNAISQADALAVIKGQEFRQWRMSMEEYLEEIEKSGNQVLLFELNTLAMRARINRLEALEGEVVAQMAKLAQIQDEAVGTHLRDSLADTYYKSMYEHYRYGDRVVFDLMKKHNVALSKSNIEKVLALPWSGSNYSRDIWKREFMIATKARDMVTRNILEGKSLEVLSREMTELLGNDYKHAARRLILTETAYVKGQGDLLTYDKLGVEEYEYLATLDNKTSKVCQDLDGEHFPISEAVPGVNYPPMHPHCRSTTIVYRKDKDEADTRVARNEAKETYKVPADMSYRQWNERYVEGTDAKVLDSKGGKSRGNVSDLPIVTPKSNSKKQNQKFNLYQQATEYKRDESLETAFMYSVKDDKIKYNPNHPDYQFYDLEFAKVHELSHRIDFMEFDSQTNKKLLDAIDISVEQLQGYFEMLADWVEEKGKYGQDAAFCDIVSALSKDEIPSAYGHDKTYWSKEGKIPLEIFANLSTIYILDKSSKNDIEELFPELTKAFKEMWA